jgi:Holliday junction resolvase
MGDSMRYANRIDANQNKIVDALRKAGAVVRIISQGDGIPDLLVGYQGFTILMEVKDGDKPPSARKLTEAEQKFFDEWDGGMLVVINSVEEALEILSRCE